MQAFIQRTGLALLSVGVCFNLSALAEAPKLAMGESTLLKGGVRIEVKEKRRQLPPLAFGDSRRQLIIDNEIRLIGGATDLSSAVQKQFPAQKFPFFIHPDDLRGQATLNIGYVRGINTPEAHAAGQSNAKFVSSPGVVKVNGVKIHYIYTDGDMIQIKIPASALRSDGFNVIQIEAGFYFMPGNRLAYDELQVQSLALRY